ncbi:MAG: exodeoxyribonuclease VII large subunit [Bacillota bacterium]
MTSIFSVSQLTSYIKALLDGDEILSSILVQGEISNFRHHSSGHMYFTLKDAGSVLRAVMFRSRAAQLKFLPSNGMDVIVQGSISVYERDGQYQLYVNSMQPAGVGALHLAFEQLKSKLQAEGLFDPGRKQPLPPYPRTVGIVTSPTGAAVRDLISVIQRRNPTVQILLAPVAVQGAQAPGDIAAALDLLSELPEVDVIIVGRGGGALEELWAFNSEEVARSIADCSKPVISAVGHETDFTIADFVADCRAPTPSAAAELAVPVHQELVSRLADLTSRLLLAEEMLLDQKRQRLLALAERRALRQPLDDIERRAQAIDHLQHRLQQAARQRTAAARVAIQEVGGRLNALNPLAVLARGYGITLTETGEIVTDPRQLQPGDRVETVLHGGRVLSIVTETRGAKNA